ncbi:MAG: DUF308 domain-containing protein [Clostridia bacterium]|nr:DUF308 domain-containing protein [Clostridia bacterium]MBR3553482.1 DUF308 domain-containing protein [Clostridia bacterium]
MKKTLVKNFIISGFVLLALGLLMLFAPDGALKLFVRVIGIIIIVGAVVAVAMQLGSKKEDRSIWLFLVAGLSAAVGVVFIVIPRQVADYSFYVFGVMLILLSVKDLFSVVRFPFGRIFSIAFSSLGIVLGTVIVCHPDQIAQQMTQFIGAALVYQAVVCFMNAILINRSPLEPMPYALKQSRREKDKQNATDAAL